MNMRVLSYESEFPNKPSLNSNLKMYKSTAFRYTYVSVIIIIHNVKAIYTPNLHFEFNILGLYYLLLHDFSFLIFNLFSNDS